MGKILGHNRASGKESEHSIIGKIKSIMCIGLPMSLWFNFDNNNNKLYCKGQGGGGGLDKVSTCFAIGFYIEILSLLRVLLRLFRGS